MRLRKLMMTTIVFALFAGIMGCGSSYVADIAGEKITIAEFEQVYAKNNGGWETASKTSVEDRQKFLDLYVKFRMKVKEAYALGYDKDSELRNELNDYRKNLGVSYMLDKEITKPALEKLYTRKLKEIRASHILVGVPSSNPVDTLLNYNNAMAIIDSLKKGHSFEMLAVNNSQDPSAQINKGDLYYFSAGQMVPEFEDAVYDMKPGDFTMTPVRSQFGMHIIKVADVKENKGAVQGSHIMKRLPRGSSPEDSSKAAEELQTVRDSILKGGDFAEFARTMSDDTFSGQRGGDLGFIERGRTVREFDEALYNLKDGELSDIVRTQFGLHLVKRQGAQGIPSYKDMEQQLRSEYQNYRFNYDYEKMIHKIRKEYGFKENDSATAAFVAAVDTSKTTNDATWDSTITASVRSMVIFTFGDKRITVDEMISRSKSNQELRNMAFNSSNTAPTLVGKMGIDFVTEYHARQMESKFPEFARTMKEYEEGILLFKAEQENVWNKVVPNDSLLRIFHASRRDQYVWPNRIDIQEIFVPTDSIAKIVRTQLLGYTKDSLVAKKTRTKSKKVEYDTIKVVVKPMSFDSAAFFYNKRLTTADHKGVWGLTPVTANELMSRAWNLKASDSTTYFPYENGFSFVKVLQKDPAREKTFEEAQSEVSGAYQEFETKRLSDEWFESLKKKFPVQYNKESLAKTFLSAVPTPKP